MPPSGELWPVGSPSAESQTHVLSSLTMGLSQHPTYQRAMEPTHEGKHFPHRREAQHFFHSISAALRLPKCCLYTWSVFQMSHLHAQLPVRYCDVTMPFQTQIQNM
jgi:hypothetical protein